MSPEHTQDSIFETTAHGKLLLTGEYFVLDGAQALAVPVRFGQSLRVVPGKESGRLSWTSLNDDGSTWFQAKFELPGLEVNECSDEKTAETLRAILLACHRQNPDFPVGNHGLDILTRNDFPRAWGLGTSSTLIAALAKWANVDPYRVLFDTMGGSGYDIACAYAEGPLLYRLRGHAPEVQAVAFRPPFLDSLYFVYLGQKQDSREGIRRYRERAGSDKGLSKRITELSTRFLVAANLPELDAVIREHEAIVSDALGLSRAKDLYFSDFQGEIKSLGAWGGDFVLATSVAGEAAVKAYFSEKGMDVVLNWPQMVGA